MFPYYDFDMTEKLSWQEIERRYERQWIQLVDYDWPNGQQFPSSGCVRLHANSREEFNRLVLKAFPVDAARLFVGEPERESNVIFSPNTVKMTICS